MVNLVKYTPRMSAKNFSGYGQAQVSESAWTRLLRAIVTFAVIALLYTLFVELGIFSFTSKLENAVGFGTAFIAGLVAATSSCLAVTGGILLSVSATWSESLGNTSHWEKFRPQLFFNIGRLIGYFLLGGVVGLIGKSLSLSTHGKGLLTVLLALVMVGLGLNMLQLIPKRFCRLPIPGTWTGTFKKMAQSRNPAAPLLLGAFTFFIPCGFTQSIQLIALASGSFLTGGLLMLAFALGTLPALLSISALSSFLEGRSARWFLALSGAFVLFLGVGNIQSGLLLMGYDPVSIVRTAIAGNDDPPMHDGFVTVDAEGRQIVSLYVTQEGYKPDSFVIEPGMETWVYAVAPEPVGGCVAFLVDATHNLESSITVGGNWLGPIKDPQEDFVLTCSIGKFRANVHVNQG